MHIVPEVLAPHGGPIANLLSVVLASLVPAALQFFDIHSHVEGGAEAAINGSADAL